jgi:aldehyde dehydrogenase (NAD+)
VIEVEGAARYFEYYGNQAETVEGRSIPLGADYLDFTIYEPFGVSAQIIPWNYPMEMTARGIAAALATGNCCVVKTPELDPISNVFIARAAAAVGLPAGAVNILCGYGHEAGAALAGHPGIGNVVFTGSVETGIKVATAAAQNVRPAILELGGKSAAIIMPDADLDVVMDSVRWGIFFNAGQVCSAMSRVIAHEDVMTRSSIAVWRLPRGCRLDRGSNVANSAPIWGRWYRTGSAIAPKGWSGGPARRAPASPPADIN